jgi:hypothetical protein
MTSLARGLSGGLVVVFLSGTASALFAQSLADVAKKEEERRKAVKETGKTYTNSDLKGVPPATGQSTTPADAAKPAAVDADKDKKDAAGQKDKSKDKDYWAGRMKELRGQLERDQTYADALQSRINQLTTDFVARDDPAQRAVIARDKQKAIEELNRLKQTIVDEKKAISDLEDEARRAGVPPGWLRS